MWSPTPRLLFLMGTTPPSHATDSSLKPQESNPSPACCPGPPAQPQQLGPCPRRPAPCPGLAHVHLLGLGCSSTSVCLKIFSVQFLVLSARARRLSKWASSSVFSAWPNFSSVNCGRRVGGEHPGVEDSAGGRGGPALPHPSTPPAWLELRPSGPGTSLAHPLWDPDQTATLPWGSACSSVTWDGWARAGGSQFVSEIQ